MFKNYLKIAFRQLVKERSSAFINILGLAIGITLTLLMLLFIRHELSYDRWLPEHQQLYRLLRSASTRQLAYVPSPVAAAAMAEAPGLIGATRINGFGEALISVGAKGDYWEGVGIADSLFFPVTGWPLRRGDPASALSRPHSVVISEAAAERLFQGENPVGRTLRLDDETEYTVTGVMAPPAGRSIWENVNFLFSENEFPPYWTGAHCQVFVRLGPSADPDRVGETITRLARRNVRQEYLDDGDDPPASYNVWSLQALSDVHLHSAQVAGYSGDHPGNIRNLGVLILLTLIVIVIAIINYMNLATARATRRAQEIGIRKVVGADRRQIIQQFLADAILQSFLALALAWLLADLALPFFEKLVDRELSLNAALHPAFIGATLGTVLLIGLLAGSYPAFYLSRFQPGLAIRQGTDRPGKGLTLRRGLVVAQFALSIIMLVLVASIWRQISFMEERDLGLNTEQVVVARLNTESGMEKFWQSRRQLLDRPGIDAASLVYRTLGRGVVNYQMNIAGREADEETVNIFFTDFAFAEVLDLKVTEGRFFDPRIASDTARAFVVNETFLREYGIEQPVGHPLKFAFDEQYGEIIGVVKDFHYLGLQAQLEPLIISARTDLAWYGGVAVRIEPNAVNSALGEIEKYWSRLEPAHPLRYTFLDEAFARNYESYTRFAQTIFSAAVLSILIAALGLFGLASFMTEQRTKEIGIRKVLGATMGQLVRLLVRDFVVLVLIAGLLALPLGYWLVTRWQADIAYPAPFSAMPFALALLMALLVAVGTVSMRVYRASIADPVDALRSE